MMTESTRNDMTISAKQSLVCKQTASTGLEGAGTVSLHVDMKKQPDLKWWKCSLCC